MNLLDLFKGMDENQILALIDKLPAGQRESLALMAEEYHRALEREKGQKSFMTFVKTMWPNFISGKHHAIMAAKFE